MEVIEYFGPKVTRVSLETNIVRLLHEICLESDSRDNDKLVGLIKEENNIFKGLKNSNLDKKLGTYINRYLETIESGMYKNVIESRDIDNYVDLSDAWYNKQVQHEFNPPHNHRHSADIVCVIFTKINISNTPDITYETSSKNYIHNGKLFFDYGYNEKNEFNTVTISVEPKEGDMYIFPSSLTHYTEPVLGKDDYRYSISCNFTLNESTKFLHTAMAKGNG